VYEISCRYVLGANRTGCSYQLTGNNSTLIRIELTGEEYALHNATILASYNNIRVLNSDSYVILSGPIATTSVMPCQTTNIPPGYLIKHYVNNNR